MDRRPVLSCEDEAKVLPSTAGRKAFSQLSGPVFTQNGNCSFIEGDGSPATISLGFGDLELRKPPR